MPNISETITGHRVYNKQSIFSKNSCNRYPIAHLWGEDMGLSLWVRSMSYVPAQHNTVYCIIIFFYLILNCGIMTSNYLQPIITVLPRLCKNAICSSSPVSDLRWLACNCASCCCVADVRGLSSTKSSCNSCLEKYLKKAEITMTYKILAVCFSQNAATIVVLNLLFRNIKTYFHFL